MVMVDTQNFSLYWMKRLDTVINEPTNLNSIKDPKVFIKVWGLV